MKRISIPAGMIPTMCKEHGVFDVIPCAWPACPNGINGDEFIKESFLEGEDETIYRRCKWISPHGSSYFTWDDGMPHWFSVRKTFWNEARRLDLVRKKHPEVIYHYTTVQAFVGIVESNCIWLSDYSYLNDRRELVHGAELAKRIIDKFSVKYTSAAQQKLLTAWKRMLLNSSQRVCVASFSADGDCLSQWRAYGPIAIGFDPYQLPLHAYQGQINPVEYDQNIQNALLEVLVQHAIQAYVADSSENRLERIPEAYASIHNLLEIIAFFKDDAFAAEREYRLAFVEYDAEVRAMADVKTPKRFRVIGNTILPYIKSDELFMMRGEKKEVKPLGIKEIVIGPHSSELTERGVKEFLDAMGFSEVPVLSSKIPFRSLSQ